MKNKFLLIAALVLGSFSMANAQGYVPGFGGKHNCVKTDFNCGWFLNEFSNIDGSGKRGMFGFGGSITYEHVFKPGIGVGVSAIMDNGNDGNVFTYFVGPSFVYAGTHGNWVVDCSAGLGEGGLKYDLARGDRANRGGLGFFLQVEAQRHISKHFGIAAGFRLLGSGVMDTWDEDDYSISPGFATARFTIGPRFYF